MPQVGALLQGAQIYLTLQQIDEELAAEARDGGCRDCGGPLHVARYPRKPRGGPVGLDDGYGWRWSFCCGACRHRLTPPSVRFLGRRVYLGTVVALLSAAVRRLSARRAGQIRELVGASRRTVRRWLWWWEREFGSSRFWRAMRGRFSPPPTTEDLPASLLDRFAHEACHEQQVATMLRFVSPVTTGSGGRDF